MSRTVLHLLAGLLTLAHVSGCATMGDAGKSLVPTRYTTTTGPYRVATNFPIAADAPAITHLQSLERQIEQNLGIRVDPGEAPIEVYILDDQKAFSHFLTFYYPELPSRRAFFLAQGDRRVVYTYLGDRLEEDLRHEATHALLHAAVADLPLWLDEGLAEYFEVPERRGGVNAEHLNRLPDDVAEGWSPDLGRLEALKDVRQMSPRDYRESWAWVHYLLNGPPAGKKALLAYLGDLRYSPEAAPLSQRLDSINGPTGSKLVAHLERVRDRPIATASQVPREPTIRLQDAPAAQPQPMKPRRSLLDRFRGLFGL